MTISREQIVCSVIKDGSCYVDGSLISDDFRYFLRQYGMLISQTDFSDFSGYGETEYRAKRAGFIRRIIWRLAD